MEYGSFKIKIQARIRGMKKTTGNYRTLFIKHRPKKLFIPPKRTFRAPIVPPEKPPRSITMQSSFFAYEKEVGKKKKITKLFLPTPSFSADSRGYFKERAHHDFAR